MKGVLVVEGTVTISSITEMATSVLSWMLSSATTIFDFMVANPLVMVFVCISLAFVGFKVIGRVIHR